MRPASATANPPRRPAQLPSVGSAMLRPLRYVRPACPATVPRRAEERPHAARRLPINRWCRPQAKKSPPPAGKACVQATQAEARPAPRSVSLGSAPNPRIYAPAEKKPGHLPRVPQPPAGQPLPPHKAGSAKCPLGSAAPKPPPKGIQACLVSRAHLSGTHPIKLLVKCNFIHTARLEKTADYSTYWLRFVFFTNI